MPYQPDASSSKTPAGAGTTSPDSDRMITDDVRDSQLSRTISPREEQERRSSQAESRSDVTSVGTISTPSYTRSQSSPFAPPETRAQSGGVVTVSSMLRPSIPAGTRAYSKVPVPLNHNDAVLVHHYTEYLGRWLDCTDATRQFTLGVPEKVKHCPVLCHAVLSFAARHRKDDATAHQAYESCIALLIDRLNEDAASHDETLLCAIVILRFYEQLNGMRRQSPVSVDADQTTFSPLKHRFRRRKALGRYLGHLASVPGRPFRGPLGAHTARSRVLGLRPPMSLHCHYQPAAA